MSRIPRSFRILAVAAVLSIGLCVIPASRHAILRAAGGALVSEDPIRAADVIVVAVDSREAGVIEAADLVRSGVSRRVALFADTPDNVDRELVRRGIHYEDLASRQVRLLGMLGVTEVEEVPVPIAGTEDEGDVFPRWCQERRIASVIVVTSPDHTRRLRRVFRRAMKGRGTDVMIRQAHYSEFDPDRWWQKRVGIRTEVVELQKLLFDFVRHPIS